MKKILLLTIPFIFNCVSLNAQGISGDWNGLLEISGVKLRLVFHLLQEEGKWTASMDSPDQGAFDIPATEAAFDPPLLRIKIAALLLEYSGTLSDNGEEVRGTFIQGGASFPLKLQRAAIEAPEPLGRPQEPIPPFPYYTEEVVFQNTDAGISLAGTLSLPQKTGKYPVAVLVSGSGPQDRDEEIMGHKPFLVLSDFLTRNGFAVLRFDDRGVGASAGDFQSATSEDFASDVLAAIAFLKTRPEVLPGKIGIIGHSEGGLIAPMVAVMVPDDVAFIVSLAGPGVDGEQILYRQQELLGRASGATAADLKTSRVFNEKAYQLIKANVGQDSAESVLYRDFTALMPAALPKDQLDLAFSSVMTTLYSPWFRFFIGFDPATVWCRVKCPVLALNGGKDLQVDPSQNLPAIGAALKKARNKKVTVKVFPELNHLFQHAGTGAVGEYESIEETFAPAVMEVIAEWLRKRK